jgi:hypothetical protein
MVVNPVEESNDDHEAVGLTNTGRLPGNVTLKKPIVTRWNSALYMLRSIADNFEAADQVLIQSGFANLKPDNQEKDLLVSVRDFLAPFQECTQLVKASGSP